MPSKIRISRHTQICRNCGEEIIPALSVKAQEWRCCRRPDLVLATQVYQPGEYELVGEAYTPPAELTWKPKSHHVSDQGQIKYGRMRPFM